jgi:hypothetical protein
MVGGRCANTRQERGKAQYSNRDNHHQKTRIVERFTTPKRKSFPGKATLVLACPGLSNVAAQNRRFEKRIPKNSPTDGTSSFNMASLNVTDSAPRPRSPLVLLALNQPFLLALVRSMTDRPTIYRQRLESRFPSSRFQSSRPIMHVPFRGQNPSSIHPST